MEILGEKFYGNTVGEWAQVLGLIVLSVIAGKFFYWVFKNWVGALTKKTKTKLDDIILDMVEEPLTYMIVFTGIRYSFNIVEFENVFIDRISYIYQFLMTISIAWLFSRLYDAMHQEYIAPLAAKTETDLDDNLLPILRKGIKVIIWGLGTLVALNNAGYDVSTVLAGLGIGGIAFALAVQHTFGNLMGGLNIFMDGHFKVGQRIQLKGSIGTIDGTVQEIGLRTTIVRSRYEGRLISIPNGMMASQEVINVDSENGRQVFTTYKLHADTSPEMIEATMKALKEIVQNNPNTVRDKVFSGIVTINELYSEIMLLFWVSPDASNLKTKTAVFMEILRYFEKSGVKRAEKSVIQYKIDAPF